MDDDTCDLFISGEDMRVKVRNEDGSNINELEDVVYLKELYEDLKKKNKLNSETFSGKKNENVMFCNIFYV